MPRERLALWGLLPHPFLGTAKREREGVSQGQVLPVVASQRTPEASTSLGPAWERLQRETWGCPGKGGWGRPAGPVLGRSCPFLGRTLMQEPTPVPLPLPCPALQLPAAPARLSGRHWGEKAAANSNQAGDGDGELESILLHLAPSLFVPQGLPAQGPANLCKRPSRSSVNVMERNRIFNPDPQLPGKVLPEAAVACPFVHSFIHFVAGDPCSSTFSLPLGEEARWGSQVAILYPACFC